MFISKCQACISKCLIDVYQYLEREEEGSSTTTQNRTNEQVRPASYDKFLRSLITNLWDMWTVTHADKQNPGLFHTLAATYDWGW